MVPRDSAVDVREAMLEAAGLHDERLAEILGEAVEVMRRQTAAKKITRTVYKGVVIDTFEDDDGRLQLAAAEALANFAVTVAGLRGGTTRDETSKGGPVNVQVNFPALPALPDAPSSYEPIQRELKPKPPE